MIRYSPVTVVVILALAVLCFGQSQGGGAAGIGRVFEASGRSVAARDLQKKLGTTLVRAVAREKAVARKSTPVGRTRPARSNTVNPVQTAPDDSATFFKPDPRSNTMARLAEELGTNPTERQQLRQLFTATKQAFENEVAAKGRSNNLPAAFTFFIASTVTVYRDDPEPSDQAIDNLWNGLSGALSETAELSSLTDAEKQQLYDMLVAFSGFVLAGYIEAKNSGDADSLNVFQTLSGEMIRTILKTEPEKLRFTKDGLNIVS